MNTVDLKTSNLPFALLSLCQKRKERYSFSLQMEAGGYRSITWTDYALQALQFSGYLKKRGIQAGDRVLLISENGPEWTMCALGTMNLGATLVPLASLSTLPEVEIITARAKPAFCVLSKRATHFLEIEFFLKSQNLPHLVWDLQELLPLRDFLQNQYPEPLNQEDLSNTVATLIFTSGTTGMPKSVPLTHRNILINARDVLQMIEADEKDRMVSVLPLSHMFEFTGGFVVPCLLGATVTYVKSLKAEDLVHALKHAKATSMVGVPLLFEVIGRNLQAKIESLPSFLSRPFNALHGIGYEYPTLAKIVFAPIHRALGGRLRFFMAGGSKLQPAVFDYFMGLGIPILQGYGLTETSPVLTVTNLTNAAPDHVGPPLPNVELAIFDSDGKKLDFGYEGEVRARGPSIFSSYTDAEHNEGAFQNGWFCTGDIGVLGEDGYLRITGRKKDIIVTPAGKNVYPEEIETVVLKTGNFLECCVLGITNHLGHEKICLVLVPDRAKFKSTDRRLLTVEAIQLAKDACKELSEYKWPQAIEVIFDELPKTLTRKIKKHEVRALLNQIEAPNQESSPHDDFLNEEDPLEGAMISGIRMITGKGSEGVRLSDSLAQDYGIDSLTFMELIGAIEKKFNVQIEGVDLSTMQTAQDLVTALRFISENTSGKKRTRKEFNHFKPIDNLRFRLSAPRWILNQFLRLFLNLGFSFEVRGTEYLREDVSYIFTPNHSSHFDMISISAALPSFLAQKTFAVAAKDYFFNRRWKAWLVRILMNAIPFDRKARIDKGFQMCREALQVGGSLTIFPEGTRSPNGILQEFKPGVAHLLAGNKNVMAVPVYIDGAYKVLPKGRKSPTFAPISVIFGRPISFANEALSPESARKITAQLRQEVAQLKHDWERAELD